MKPGLILFPLASGLVFTATALFEQETATDEKTQEVELVKNSLNPVTNLIWPFTGQEDRQNINSPFCSRLSAKLL